LREDKKIMVRNPAWLYKILVVGVIFLSIGISVTSATNVKNHASEIIQNVTTYNDLVD
jgi:hypothetical protein